MNTPDKTDRALSPDLFVSEFHRLLGRLVCAHSRFDMNVGLQLRFLGRLYGAEVAPLLDPRKVPFSKRLKELRRLVLDVFEPAGERGMAEFSEFFDQASEATALRNDYVHGQWNWHYRQAVGGEMVLCFSPLHWELEVGLSSDSISMTLEVLAEQITQAETVLSNYYRVVEKYRRFAKPSPLDDSFEVGQESRDEG